jgi:pimeloyl-ACP methyl ester carboxylesterase
MSAASTPEGPGSVSGAPNLPEGFTDTFTSRYVDAGTVRLHAVIGGDGPPLLLVHGWPQTWYAWRMVMPALARDFQVVAVDQRGIGLSDKPQDGYDTGTFASDLAALMTAFGPSTLRHVRDRRRDADRLRPGRRSPGPAGAPSRLRGPPPGRDALAPAVPSPAAQRPALAPRLQPAPRRGERSAREGTGGHLLRRGVRRLRRDQQAAQGRRQVLHQHARIRPRSPARELRLLPGDPHHHRPEPAAQGTAADHAVLAIGGAESSGAMVGATMQLVADDVRTVVLAGAGQWVAEQAPEELLAALATFLAPYREGVLA